MDSFVNKDNQGTLYLNMLIVYYVYGAMVDTLLPKGSTIGVVISLMMFGLALYYGFFYNRFRNIFNSIFIFLFFLFFLIFFMSSNYYVSYKDFIKFSIGFLSLPIGYNILGTENSIVKYWKVLLIIAHIYIINAIIANVFHLGGGYTNNGIMTFETGNLFSAALYVNVYTLVMLPFFVRFNHKRLYMFGLMSLIAALVVVNMKRTPILCVVVAAIIFVLVLMYLNFKYGHLVNNTSLKYVLVFSLFLGLTFWAFQDIIERQLQQRDKKMKVQNIEKEARLLEFLYVYDEIVRNGDVKTFLLGKETFNTVGTYANGRFGARMIHQDYTLLLHSTGVVGFIWYIGFQICILILPFRRKYSILYVVNRDNRLLLAIYASFICVHLIAMGSGTTRLVFENTVCYLTVGMILRIFDDQYYDEKYILPSMENK